MTFFERTVENYVLHIVASSSLLDLCGILSNSNTMDPLLYLRGGVIPKSHSSFVRDSFFMQSALVHSGESLKTGERHQYSQREDA